MKKLVLLLIVTVSIGTQAQSRFEQGMQKAFGLWQEGKPWDAANMFERIANAEPNEWLPPFYVAQINVFQSFNEKDEAELKAKLKKAQDFLNDAKTLSPENNEELHLLQAQLLTCWVIFDGMKYGMTMSPKITQLYAEARKMAPNNPRVAFGKVEWEFGAAQYFKQDITPFCDDMKNALALFDSFEPKGPFYPSGGKEYAQQTYNRTCGSTPQE
ncbi:hypothetical protein [Aegicerativicinus sediminis]